MLLWSKSRDDGETWTPHEFVPLETVASRMHVIPAGGDRFMMVHNGLLARVYSNPPASGRITRPSPAPQQYAKHQPPWLLPWHWHLLEGIGVCRV
jgi:hypothetical protein